MEDFARTLKLFVLTTVMASLAFGLSPSDADAANADTQALPPTQQDWGFEGPLGTFDRAALQRGYQVYREVCASCHSMRFVAFRNLGEPGGPEFSEAAVKVLAAEFIIEDGPDDFGDMFDRPGLPSDYFPDPYRNEEEARAANDGIFPPDLSLITKARHNGPDYLYALMTGYEDPPAGFEMQELMNYNPYFPGRQIAMTPQLIEGIIEYTDGTEANVTQMARDVTEFLHWAAEPKMEERKAMAQPVLFYLLFLAGLLYLTYKKVWRDVGHE